MTLPTHPGLWWWRWRVVGGAYYPGVVRRSCGGLWLDTAVDLRTVDDAELEWAGECVVPS